MATYTTLRQGSDNKSAVLDLQKKLNTYGNAGLDEDGIFGAKTYQAVVDYQRANGLQVDGIVGNETWGHLNSREQSSQQQAAPQAAPVTAQPEKSYRYDYDNDPAYQDAQQRVTDLEGNKPTYQGTYDQQVEQLFQELQGQKEFTYDLNGDALWQQYKDQYTAQGKLAMMDTMGQAAALTGGYASSYAQGAGQQAYQGYLQQMNDRIPELYQLALQKYNNDQAMLKDRFATAKGMADDEYAKHRDDLSDYYTQLGIAREDANTAYDRGHNAWYTEESLRREDENTEYTRKENNYNKVFNLIATTGQIPSQEMLDAAGMDISTANALAAQYEKEMAAAYSSSSGGSGNGNDEPEYVTPSKEQEAELREMFENCGSAEDVEAVLTYAGNRNYDMSVVDALYEWYSSKGFFDF